MKNKLHAQACSYCIIAIFIFAGMHCFAQDTIVKRGGQQILGKILEVSQTEIKYKKDELKDGPVYIEDKATIVKIKYQGGYVDLFPEVLPQLYNQPGYRMGPEYRPPTPKYPAIARSGSGYVYNNRDLIGEREMQDILLAINDREITREVRNARLSKGLSYIGFLAIPLGIIAFSKATGFYDYNFNGNYRTNEKAAQTLAVAGGLMIGTSIYLNINKSYRNAKALRLYKQNYVLKNEK